MRTALRRLRDLLPLARYRVEGESMAPTVSPEERVVVSRAAYWFGRPKEGDLVVARDPREPDRLLLKRVDRAAQDGGLVLHGDNPGASTDSRQFGPVNRDLIVGKVWLRY